MFFVYLITKVMLREFLIPIIILIFLTGCQSITTNNPTDQTNTEPVMESDNGQNQDKLTLLYTTLVREISTNGRTRPIYNLWQRMGNNEPELLLENVGGENQYPHDFILGPNQEWVIMLLETEVQLFNLKTEEIVNVHTANIPDAVFSPDGKSILLLANEENLTVYEYDIPTRTLEVRTQIAGKKYPPEFFIENWSGGDYVNLSLALGEWSNPFRLNLITGELTDMPLADNTPERKISDDGKYYFYSANTVPAGCPFVSVMPSTLNVLKQPTDEVIGRFGETDMVIEIVAFSPDGDALLYTVKNKPELETDAFDCDEYYNSAPVLAYSLNLPELTKREVALTEIDTIKEEWNGASVLFTTKRYDNETDEVVYKVKDEEFRTSGRLFAVYEQ